MKVYLAGPMTGVPLFNHPAFHAAAKKLREQGHEVINPAELDEEIGTDEPWDVYLRRDLAMLVTCDAIALLPGWEKFRGARLEKHVACELGLRVLPSPL